MSEWARFLKECFLWAVGSCSMALLLALCFAAQIFIGIRTMSMPDPWWVIFMVGSLGAFQIMMLIVRSYEPFFGRRLEVLFEALFPAPPTPETPPSE